MIKAEWFLSGGFLRRLVGKKDFTAKPAEVAEKIRSMKS